MSDSPSNHQAPSCPTSAAAERLYWIDWARFLAALAVVLSHAIPSTLAPWTSLAAEQKTPWVVALYAAGSFGQEAVILFFVLSGYLVGGKLCERLMAGRFDLRKYAIDRATRIYVPFLPAAVLSLVVWASLGHAVDLRQWSLNLVQMQGVLCKSFAGNGVFWTLAYEVWFYVLGGAVGAALTLRGIGRLAGILVALATLGLFTRLEPAYLGCWLIGAGACLLGRLGFGWRATALGCALLVGSLYALSPYGLAGRDTALHRVFFLLLSAGCGLVILGATRRQPVGALAAFESLGTRLADSSYTLYLIHGPVLISLAALYPMHGLPPGLVSSLAIAAQAALSLLAAWLFYLPFERQTSRVRSWLSARTQPVR